MNKELSELENSSFGNIKMLSDGKDRRFIDGFFDLSSKEHFWFQWRFRAFQKQLRDIGIANDSIWKVLDVGAGRGTLRDQVEAATAWNIDISDLDLEGLRRADPARGETLFYNINQRVPDLEERYDAIILFDVLEHIEETRTFIESLLFHLRPGGFLFVNVPAMQRLFCRFDTVQGHFRRYDRRSLKTEFDGFPVSIVDARYWGMLNVPLLYLRRFVLDALSSESSDEEVYRKGFAPPSGIANRTLRSLMRIELALVSRPPFGSSLLTVFRKTP